MTVMRSRCTVLGGALPFLTAYTHGTQHRLIPGDSWRILLYTSRGQQGCHSNREVEHIKNTSVFAPNIIIIIIIVEIIFSKERLLLSTSPSEPAIVPRPPLGPVLAQLEALEVGMGQLVDLSRRLLHRPFLGLLARL